MTAGAAIPGEVRPVVRCHGLGRRHDDRIVLEDVSFSVTGGEIFGVIGSDGAGKSTLLQMLAGILRPSAGDAEVLGFDLRAQARHVSARIGYMPQVFSLYGRLTVEENLDFFAELHRVASPSKARRAQRLLEFAGLAGHRKRLARDLSGGMQKKLALCCALIHEPPLLLLDEPTTGVDPVSRREFWNILNQTLREGTAIVVSTPYMDEAERCHRVVLLHAGKVIAVDSPHRLRQRIAAPLFEVRAVPQRQALRILQAELPPSRAYALGDRIRLQGGAGDWSSLLKASDIRIDEVRAVEAGLADVFVELLGAPAAAPVTGPLPASSGSKHESAVDVRDLTVRFGAFTAVDRISFRVGRGEIFGFLGPNGSGKTTTIRVLCGLLTPTSGEVTVAGRSVARDAPAVRSRIGYMSQRFSLYDDLTVDENVHFFAGAYGVAQSDLPRRRNWALELAGLRGEEARLAGSLSGSVKQRLALACAVLHEPDVLFLDEPTAGVDPVARRRFWELIAQLSERGVTVFVTTHYMDEAEHCNTLALLYSGRLIALGSPAQLRDRMSAAEMLVVVCDRPFEAQTALSALPATKVSIFGDRLHVMVDDAQAARQAIMQRLAAVGHRVSNIHRAPLSIEDVFIAFIDMEQARTEHAAEAAG